MKERKRVIIIGGGFGGINAAKGLGNSEFDVILLDKTNHHLFQPLLYQVASAALSPGDIAVPIREIVSKYKNITVLMENVKRIVTTRNEIETSSGRTYTYDYLILAVGAKHSYFNHPYWEKFAPGLKTLSDALTIRNHLLHLFEEAEKNDTGPSEELNLVVIGAGPTGVELAGVLAEISKQTLVNDFRKIDPSRAKIYLIEGASQILGMYPENLAKKAQSYLEELGVTVLLNSIVTNITEDFVEINERKIKTHNVIWAAGNKASALLADLGTELDKVGRVVVKPNLSTKEYENVYVIGDAACFRTAEGETLPALAPVASQQGRFLARELISQRGEAFVYVDKGIMATIGKFKAIVLKNSLQLTGFIAWLVWCFVHIFFLIGFRNKVVVFTQWAISFFFAKRGVRLISELKD